MNRIDKLQRLYSKITKRLYAWRMRTWDLPLDYIDRLNRLVSRSKAVQAAILAERAEYAATLDRDERDESRRADEDDADERHFGRFHGRPDHVNDA